MTTIVQTFPTLSDFIAWLDERADEKKEEAKAETTVRRSKEKSAYAEGLRTAARALQDARIEDYRDGRRDKDSNMKIPMTKERRTVNSGTVNPFRVGTKRYLIAESLISGRDTKETYDHFAPLVGKSEPWIFRQHVLGGSRLPRRMSEQKLELKNEVGRVASMLVQKERPVND